jgi:hypothetical protein
MIYTVRVEPEILCMVFLKKKHGNLCIWYIKRESHQPIWTGHLLAYREFKD